ncbi:MAG TPA: FdtA/QdtA family cupin domain-containing protein [Gaiellaceae bacterium]|nr:FdtA/QdtA family cupin domain-containing protein [Gaiellaceae bacterium]
MPTASVDDCRYVALPEIPRQEGSIATVSGASDIPFELERVFFLYDIPAGATRSGHAHRGLQEVLVCVMGSFKVVVKDGARTRTFELSRPHVGLYLPPLLWRELIDFSAGSVCLVLASHHYDEADYIRDYDAFVRLKATTQ